MTLSITETPVPLTTDSDGVVRVARTRVTLDTVVAAFAEGATAEEIAQQYPSLDLADVYSVLAYFLRHRSEVEMIEYAEFHARRSPLAPPRPRRRPTQRVPARAL